MGEIKAIETVYKGYRFRSRLEARWAVFFDALGVEYEYEPEGYVLSNGEKYLPDFYLPKLRIYVEVKNANVNLIEFSPDDYVHFNGEQKEKYGAFMHDMTQNGYGVWFVFGDPYDALFSFDHGGKGKNYLFAECTCIAKVLSKNKTDKCRCKGKERIISKCDFDQELFSAPIIGFGKDFAIWGVREGAFPDSVIALPLYFMRDCINDTQSDKLIDSTKKAAKKTLTAIQKARQARFEHGETPII